MAWATWLAPLCAAGLVGLGAASLASARARERWPAALTLLLAVGAASVALHLGWLASIAFIRGLGCSALIASAALAVSGSRRRRIAERLAESAPRALDDAAARGGGDGLLAGTLDCNVPVLSPGGVDAAMYDAELRAVDLDGRPGTLLATERRQASSVFLCGRRIRAVLEEATLEGPRQVRPCIAVGRWRLFVREAISAGGPAIQALSHERAARVGDGVLVLGRLERTQAGWMVRGSVLVMVGLSVEQARRTFSARAWKRFGGAVLLALAAAWLLGEGALSFP